MSDKPKQKCTAHRSTDGKPCTRWATHGATVCASHGARTPQVARAALVRAEISQWRLGDAVDDPGETLLRLLTQSVRRADIYAALQEEAFEAAKNDDTNLGAAWKMPRGVAALIGHRYSAGADGYPATPISEAIRGLVDLEMREREFAANLATKAITAGLAERVVRVQEAQAAQVHAMLMASFDAVGLPGDLRVAVLADLAGRFRSLGVEAKTIVQ